MIKEFKGEFDFLSNFYICPIVIDGMQYNTNEHYYQAMKALKESDKLTVANCEHAGQAKKLGRKIEIRPDWERINGQVMYNAVVAKFAQAYMRVKLLGTGDMLIIEGNYWHDNTWGNCMCPKCETVVGKNRLGKITMAVRLLLDAGVM